ncbi:MAG TPA: prepilin-type N-terminal cleavage/methylation domain-containing protein [Ramlibacter sp.]|nr:prepilin-type N-terminal cleavage/methylation domain-containing protein [Ramlibacter sp.]
MKSPSAGRGFTLVELLVALLAMSLLAVMSWRGLDGMTRAQALTEARADQVLTLQVGLQQWAADLDAIIQLPQVAALDWNGRVLRMTRRGTGATTTNGVVVVAWGRRVINGTGTWLRWQSAEITTRDQLQQAWQQADIWSQNPGAQEMQGEVAVTPLEEWQLFYFRGGAWTNPMSSDATAVTPLVSGPAIGGTATVPGTPVGNLPDGVRLILTLPPGQAIAGTLTRDWARPTLSGPKS